MTSIVSTGIKTLVIVTVALLLAGSSCDNTTDPPGDPLPSKSMTNVQPDSAEEVLFIDLDGDSIVPLSGLLENEWDICLSYLKCCGQTRAIDVFLNSGNDGTGTTQGAVVTSRWENLTQMPNIQLLDESDDPLFRIINPAVVGGDLMFIYDAAADHTIKVSPDKVLVLRSGKTGTEYKFQFTSIYLDAEPNPTQNTPLGFYHFRYQQANNGAW